MARYKVFLGNIVHSVSATDVEILRAAVVVEAETGTIDRVDALCDSYGVQYTGGQYCLYPLKDSQFLVPGFIDTHVHAPQYKFTGTGTDLPLFAWLDNYTFPTESGMSNLQEARQCYSKMIARLLANGTTTAVYYATLDPVPTKVLVDLLHEQGQRAIVGKVSMDRNAPAHYVCSTSQDLAEAREVVEHVVAKGTARLMPCVVPRFIPTCTPELMQGLAKLAEQHGAYIQSHISESWAEVEYVRSLHPESPHDTAVFQDMGLLTGKTVMAHGTLLGDEEINQLAAKGVCLAHCPLSNFFFGDAPFRVKHALSLGLKVGLGTDIAGGYSPSMLSAMRASVVNSQVVRMQQLQQTGFAAVGSSSDGQEVLSYKEAFWLATLGGAEALGLGHVLGSFRAGKQFDALLVDTEVSGGPFDVFSGDTMLQKFEKFVNLGDDRNILEVYVDGKRVK